MLPSEQFPGCKDTDASLILLFQATAGGDHRPRLLPVSSLPFDCAESSVLTGLRTDCDIDAASANTLINKQDILRDYTLPPLYS